MSYSGEMILGGYPVAQADVDTRARFIVRTYAHLAGAIAAFTIILVLFFTSGVAETMTKAMIGSRFAWLVVLGAFMLVSWIASGVAHRVSSPVAQYAALSAYVLVEAVTFVPLIWTANRFAPGVLQSAVLVTGLGFTGLTLVAFWTRKDFSFLGGILRFVGVCVLVGIVASLCFGFTLGTWFSVGMIAFAGAAILYNTSNILHVYPEDRHIAAALELFAAVALLFWYVIRLFLKLRN
jgi:FtsH-binding integral membrane protein